MKKVFLFFIVLLIFVISDTKADNGYRLWLKYDLISNQQKLNEYRQAIKAIKIEGESPAIKAAQHELQIGLNGLIGTKIPEVNNLSQDGTLIIGKYKDSPLLSKIDLKNKLDKVGAEGYLIFNTELNNKKIIVITANEDVGVLYGTFHFLRLLQTNQDINNINIVSFPKIKLRILDHWDNLNGSVGRGYAGCSIWNWHTLPTFIKKRYIDYARANASIGINGAVLNNVNADPLILTHRYLLKVAALADVFRQYGIRVYVSANFDAPLKLGGLNTADPFNKEVQDWWKNKVKEIYSLIPDFGGFLVKANSEGEPGPQDYGRTQADGANLLANALKPFNGIVMWRAFIYSYNARDRAKEA
ncbi:MAG: alpha-glucuronidase family glycosyl hydrolase, partial [Ignavibacteriaceae bacterium]